MIVYNCTLNSGCMDAKLRVKTLCFIMIYCITHFPLAQVRHFKSEQSYLGLKNKRAAQAIGFSTCCSNKPPKSKKHFLWGELHCHQILCRSRLTLIKVKAKIFAGCQQSIVTPRTEKPRTSCSPQLNPCMPNTSTP